MALSAATFFVADSTAQLIERYAKTASARGLKYSRQSFGELTREYSLARVLRYAFVGGLVMAPIFHAWYQIIERLIPGRRLWYQKLLLECFTIAPLYLACNMTAATSLKSLGIFEVDLDDGIKACNARLATDALQQVYEDVRTKLLADFPRLYFNALTVVPMYQAVNYRFVPLRYRMFWLNACQLLFNIWVSHRVATEVAPTEEGE